MRAMLTRSLLALALASPASAGPGALSHEYTLYLGGLRAAEMEVDAKWDAERFVARSELRTVGLARLLYSGFYRASAEGEVAPAGFAPGVFEAVGAFEDDRQEVRIAYEAGRPLRVEARPPFKPRPWEIDPAAQAGTLDPFSAALMLIRPEPVARICDRVVDVFDGRRRTRITLGPPAPSHDGIRCKGTYTRVAGFSPRSLGKGNDFPFTVVFRENRDGLAEVWQVFADTDFGRAVAQRRS